MQEGRSSHTFYVDTREQFKMLEKCILFHLFIFLFLISSTKSWWQWMTQSKVSRHCCWMSFACTLQDDHSVVRLWDIKHKLMRRTYANKNSSQRHSSSIEGILSKSKWFAGLALYQCSSPQHHQLIWQILYMVLVHQQYVQNTQRLCGNWVPQNIWVH